MITRIIAVASILIAVLAVLAVSLGPKAEATDKIQVVVSILPQAEFVERVGGDRVTVTVMVGPGDDPHTYAPTFSQLVAVSQATLYAEIGSGIDFELSYMGSIIEANRDMLAVNCSQGVDLIQNDPHIWLSPRNAKIMVKNICDGLVEVDPQDSDYYVRNENTYLAELDAVDAAISSTLSGVADRWFLVDHPAWTYFARDYNLTQLAIRVEGKTPSPDDLTNAEQEARAHNIKVVFASPEFSVETTQTVADQIGASVAFIDPLSRDYVNNMYQVLNELAKAMK